MIGIILNGYIIESYIGKGQFGSVYKCTKDGNSYAIKVFNSEFIDAEIKRNGTDNRITREIEALKKVSHKNVASYIDHSTFMLLEQTYYYVIMELIEGCTLKDLILGGTLIKNPKDSVGIILQVLEGLNQIHLEEIVHRDLKPDNIRITNNGEVKILDFGLSKLINFSSITETGTTIGSPLYMSPEHITDGKRADERADLYSIGVILYEMLTGNMPFNATTNKEELYRCILNEAPTAPSIYWPSIPNKLENIIMRLLKKKKHERYPNARAVIEALKEEDIPAEITIEEWEPTFILRLYNEKTVVESYYKQGYKIDAFEFPANLKDQQKNLLLNIQASGADLFIDPATLRLAYSRFKDIKGLVALPYAPKGYDRLNLNDIDTAEKKKTLVREVIDCQLENKATKLITPYFFAENSEDSTLPVANKEDWFLANIKLAKESIEYVDGKHKLFAGVAIKSSMLNNERSRNYFIDALSNLACDGYIISVDKIDNDTNSSDLYNYVTTLLKLQECTNKPVIAGRVNCIGLGLLAHGLYGFSSGASYFDSFYEGLLRDEGLGYNMYFKYYIPELMLYVPILRKDPNKLKNILTNPAGRGLICTCPFCKGNITEVVEDKTAKLHFLYRRNEEINELRSLKPKERVEWFDQKLNKAEELYRALSTIFKNNDYSYIREWKAVFGKIKGELF